MARFLALMLTAALLIFPEATGTLAKERAKKSKEREPSLVGSWEVARETATGTRHFMKHLTKTHFTVVHFDPDTHVPLVTIGGTWKRDGDTYIEHVDYATDTHKHLRGRTFVFKIRVDDETWRVDSVKDSPITSHTTWQRVRANDGEPRKK